MKDKKRSFTLIEVIIAAVLLTIGVAGGIAGYKVANRQIEQANIKNMAMAENGRIQEMIASWDIDDDNLKETAEPRPIDISNTEFEEKYSPEAFYTVRDITDAEGDLLYKEITVTVRADLSGKNIKVQTQSVKTNFEESEFIPLVHYACVNGKCTKVAGAGADTCTTDAECQGGGTHSECTADGRCIEAAGAGADTCTTDAECQGGGTHSECTADGRCIEVTGAGADTCTTDAECQGGGTHSECTADGRCVEAAGAGADTCTTDAECQGGGGGKAHNECTADGRCVEVAGTGADTCTTDADCECTGELCSGCNCTPWEGKGCGLGNCKPEALYEVRVCNSIEGEHCDVEERCVYGTEECMGCNACSDWVEGACGADPCGGPSYGPLYRHITRNCPDDKPYCIEESCSYDPKGCQACDSCTSWVDGECSWQVGYRIQVRECFPKGCGVEKQAVQDDTCGCECGSWEDRGCGKGGCSNNLMFQRRQCVPSGCDETKRCCEHRDCPPPQ